jgi:hypothetical protein
MPRSPRHLPQGYSFHITLRCNSRQFLIAKGLRRDVLLAVLAKAQAKLPHRLYAVCLMANHLHLLIRPEDARRRCWLLAAPSRWRWLLLVPMTVLRCEPRGESESGKLASGSGSLLRSQQVLKTTDLVRAGSSVPF